MHSTPQSLRTHIAFFGLRNAGKSTLVNEFTGQELSIVSDVAGTTTDPVSKAMEILPLGPCLVTDTAGLDDVGALGEMRVRKSLDVLATTDIAVWVAAGSEEPDGRFMEECRSRGVEVFIHRRGDSVAALKEKIAHVAPAVKPRALLEGLVERGDRVLCVCPIDESAPKGRLILPQQQLLRECLDIGATATVCQVQELGALLKAGAWKLVVTDSQAFADVGRIMAGSSVPLTSFSILFARQKGDVEEFARGVVAIANLKDGDKVLIAEGCTHHRQCNDIGTVKLPKAISKLSGKSLEFVFSSGRDFPLAGDIALVVQCGGCMLTRRDVMNRIERARSAHIPIANYGMTLFAAARGDAQCLREATALLADAGRPEPKPLLSNVIMALSGRRFARGDIYVENGRISRIDESAADASSPRYLVLPGFVNAHGHTAMTLLRGVGGGLPLQRWLEEAIFPREAKMRPGDIAAGMTLGAMEMLAGGTTCVADMYDFPEAGEAALSASGMKGNLCRVGLAFPDGSPKGRLEECAAYCEREPIPRIMRDLCIHSEYLTDEKFCRSLAELNSSLRRPVHVHVSETQKEHSECISRHGKTPFAYLASTGILDHGAYAAHCVWATDEDFLIMAEKGVSLVHCPSSNMKLASGFARIVAAMKSGVNVALGTDGCASNDNLDMFEEMHLASLIQKGSLGDPTALSPWDVIEMATINGARAIGRGDETGEIRVGKAADLMVIDLSAPHLFPIHDLASLIVHSMHSSDVVATYVDGVKVYDRGEWKFIDKDRAYAAVAESASGLQ